MLGTTADAAKAVRYQLIYGVAAAVIAAKEREANLAASLAHEFVSGALSTHALERNARDLALFVGHPSQGASPIEVPAGKLLGPWRLPGGGPVSPDIDL